MEIFYRIKRLFRHRMPALLFGFMALALFSPGAVLAEAGQGLRQTGGFELRGTVTDEAGEGIPGVNVSVKNSGTGTITSLNGEYGLRVKAGDIVVFSFVGYKSAERKVGSRTKIDVQLEPNVEELDEVVVVGYGVQKKVNLTGAVARIDAEALESRPIRNISEGIQGTMPGVSVLSQGGQPGASSSIMIRGITSVNSGGPLVIVDGIQSTMDDINTADVESISVLKDAASAAIYGARAAEGVILITTKSGKSGKLKVSYNGNYTIKSPGRKPEINDSWTHAEYANTAFVNEGKSAPYSAEEIALMKDPNVSAFISPNAGGSDNEWTFVSNTDWSDLLLQETYAQNHDLAVSGGGDVTTYRVSGAWSDQVGMFDEYGDDSYTRYNFRLNMENKLIKDILTLKTNISYSNEEFQLPVSDYNKMLDMIYAMGSNIPVYDPNGNYARFRNQRQPVQTLAEGGFINKGIQNTQGNMTLVWKPLDGLVLTGIGGLRLRDYIRTDWARTYNKYRPDGTIEKSGPWNRAEGENSLTELTENRLYATTQLLANYMKSFGKHDINVLAGASSEYQETETISVGTNGVLGNELPSLGLGSNEGLTKSFSHPEWALLSYFSRVKYAYDNRYLFEANVRVDGSSKFSNKHRWGTFPSFSLGWRVSEESFMQNQSVISNLKFIGSWGQLGNQSGLGTYDHISKYEMEQKKYYDFPGEDGQWMLVKSLASEDRTWETSEVLNVGATVGFFDNRLQMEGNYFVKKTRDMLVNFEVPAVIGIKVPKGNFGDLETKGWDLVISWKDQLSNGLKYGFAFNMADQKNKLIDYAVDVNTVTPGLNRPMEGYPLFNVWGLETNGFIQTQEEADDPTIAKIPSGGVSKPGDIRYVDKNGDGVISNDDAVYLGDQSPRYEYGFSANASWKNFDFSIFFQGVAKRSQYLDVGMVGVFSEVYNNNTYTFQNDYWTPENTNADYPNPRAGYKNNYALSDWWLQDAAYVRLKNLQVGYTLPKTLSRKIRVNRLRVYFSGENLWESSELVKAYDPELYTLNYNSKTVRRQYPIMRSYSFGLNLTL
ncbi:SusC/RagA family TonB-linked outer membrane protein [Fulvitalea axinellae]|uniref:SusC/RagA family TonB-linked outer membrane protein n=1 Tax=Fulvitalea axinellae TaxID=1182444 RepID=A0AAU9CJH0_9BACT|nr:SusC/RagA family TonB-linked outer membrane protein [Fulvitalea axinellae]